jgi:hypothetical protein
MESANERVAVALVVLINVAHVAEKAMPLRVVDRRLPSRSTPGRCLLPCPAH